jgi:hypothetical protein
MARGKDLWMEQGFSFFSQRKQHVPSITAWDVLCACTHFARDYPGARMPGDLAVADPEPLGGENGENVAVSEIYADLIAATAKGEGEQLAFLAELRAFVDDPCLDDAEPAEPAEPGESDATTGEHSQAAAEPLTDAAA